MTKAGRTKHKAQNKKKEIANIFNDDLAQEEKQEDWASRYILSTRRISKWLPFLYMSISWILTYGLVCIQARSIKDSDFILNVELFFLFIEFMAISFYVYHHVCVWDTDIRRAMQKLSEKAKG